MRGGRLSVKGRNGDPESKMIIIPAIELEILIVSRPLPRRIELIRGLDQFCCLNNCLPRETIELLDTYLRDFRPRLFTPENQ